MAKMGKRGQGEGSVYQRADGRWCSQVTLPGGKRKYLYGKTRKAVAAQLAALQHDLARGVTPGDGRQTVGTWLATWLESVRPPELDPSTWKRYEEYVRLHITPALGSIKLAALQPQRIQQLYTDLQRETGLSSTTVHHIHAVLHRGLEMALRFDLLGRNPASMVKAPRMRERDIRPLSRDEARVYLNEADDHRLATLYTLALATGMRQGELLALRWRDVDMEALTLSVTASLYVRKGVALFKPPKTKGSRRQIAFAPHVALALRAHHARQREERLKAGAAWQEFDLVFTTASGTPISPRHVQYLHQKFLRLAGITADRRVRFHDLRHTCATLLLAQRINPKIVSEMLGHASVGITLDIYSHVLPDMQQDAAAALALALGWA